MYIKNDHFFALNNIFKRTLLSTKVFRIATNNRSKQYRSISKNNVGGSKIYYSILQYCGFHFSIAISSIVILASRGRTGLFSHILTQSMRGKNRLWKNKQFFLNDGFRRAITLNVTLNFLPTVCITARTFYPNESFFCCMFLHF